MYTFVPLDVTINLYSFLCVPYFSITMKTDFEIGHGFSHCYTVLFVFELSDEYMLYFFHRTLMDSNCNRGM